MGAADPQAAVRVLVSLKRCPGGLGELMPVLFRLGSPGIDALLAWLRSDDPPACERVDIATWLQASHLPLSPADAELSRYLVTSHCLSLPGSGQGAPPETRTLAPTDSVSDATRSLLACRAEGHLPPMRMPTIDASAARVFAACLTEFACGPSRASYDHTLRRCCTGAFGAHPPEFCKPKP